MLNFCFDNANFHFVFKEQLLRGKIRSGEMSSISIPIITNVVRSFLLSLKEPLVTYTARESFIKLAYMQEEIDVQVRLAPYYFRDLIYYCECHHLVFFSLDNCLFSYS
jgi:hypothetical protein